jgi:hypothetical protein
VSYFCDSVKWPGSKIGTDYSVGLPGRGVRYSAEAPQAAATAPPAESKKTIPQTPNSANQITHSVPAKTWSFDSRNAIESGAMSSPFSIVCVAAAELLARLAQIGIEFFKKIMAWLSRKLGLVGLGMTSNEATRSVQISPKADYIDVQARHVQDPKLIENAAAEINQVAQAIEKNDAELLPESANDLAKFFEKEGSTEQDPFAFVAHGDQEDETATPAPEPVKPWPALRAATEVHHLAAQALSRARAYAAEDTDIWGALSSAEKAENEAKAALINFLDKDRDWRDHSLVNKLAHPLGGSPWKKHIEAAQAALERRRAELVAAKKEEASKPARRAPVVAVELIESEKTAAENLTAARVVLMTMARANLAVMRQDPMQVQAANLLEMQIQKGISYYAHGRDNADLAAKIQVLKNAVEAERRRQNPTPHDPEAEAEMQALRTEIEAAPK